LDVLPLECRELCPIPLIFFRHRGKGDEVSQPTFGKGTKANA